MTRHEQRELIFTLLYEYTYYEELSADAFLSSRVEASESAYPDYVGEAFLGATSSLTEIDKAITDHAVGWKVSRMSRVTRSILRLAVYELKFTDTPPKAVINEAVELSKTYDEEKASAFINGILNKFARAEGKISDSDE